MSTIRYMQRQGFRDTQISERKKRWERINSDRMDSGMNFILKWLFGSALFWILYLIFYKPSLDIPAESADLTYWEIYALISPLYFQFAEGLWFNLLSMLGSILLAYLTLFLVFDNRDNSRRFWKLNPFRPIYIILTIILNSLSSIFILINVIPRTMVLWAWVGLYVLVRLIMQLAAMGLAMLLDKYPVITTLIVVIFIGSLIWAILCYFNIQIPTIYLK